MPGVVSVLEGEADLVVRELWREVEERCGFVAQPPGAVPHLTYHVAAAYETEALKAAVQAIAADSRPFEVDCSGIGIFTGSRMVLYLAVARPVALSRFHQRVFEVAQALAVEPGPYWQPQRWVPHVTIAMEGLTADAAGALTAAWAARPIPPPLRISNVAVMDGSDGTHRLLAECPLGGGQAGDLE
jgi:2'-5' RNA ligase